LVAEATRERATQALGVVLELDRDERAVPRDALESAERRCDSLHQPFRVHDAPPVSASHAFTTLISVLSVMRAPRRLRSSRGARPHAFTTAALNARTLRNPDA